MKILDKITYKYLTNIKKWMVCPNCEEKMIYKKEKKKWICESCKYSVSDEEMLNGIIFWFCDKCEDYLNSQRGFDDSHYLWKCTSCGYKNSISEDCIIDA